VLGGLSPESCPLMAWFEVVSRSTKRIAVDIHITGLKDKASIVASCGDPAAFVVQGDHNS
jgi:hypothetical protein